MSVQAKPLILGTRGSRLALWQAEHIQQRLRDQGVPGELRIITTKGDRVQDIGFDKLEGKGFFTKEIESELLAGTIDLAVHSCKDLETRDPEGLHIAAIAGRAACEELLIIRREAVEDERTFSLRKGAIVGTSSARRKSQLRMFRSDVVIQDLRGNVPTRVEKLRSGAYDAILLAKAGIDRLGLDLSDLHVITLDARWFVPAPAQGALAVQTRIADTRTDRAVQALRDTRVEPCVALERAVLFAYHGGCQVPLGVHAKEKENGFDLWASAARTWEEMPRRIHLSGNDPNVLAAEMVRRLQVPIAPFRVLVTRDLKEVDTMRAILGAHALAVIGVPLLTAVAVPFTLPSDLDRLFFTSRNAVRCFVQGGGRLDRVPCDAIGVGTADELRKHGGKAAFVGEGPDAHAIAVSYAEQHANDRVVFPCAAQGAGTVQRAMPLGHAIDVVVYAMRPVEHINILGAEVAVITSPDNAAALHGHRPLHMFQACIAMGTSTAARVQELAGVNAIVPWSSNGMALIDAVFGLATDPRSPVSSN